MKTRSFPTAMVTLFLTLSVLYGQAVSAQEPFSSNDVLITKRVTTAEISPNGEWIAYTVEFMRPADAKAGTSYSELYLVSPKTKETRPFVVGEERVTSIAWRPDGSAIAFLAKRRDNKENQVWMIPVAGGEARQVTTSSIDVLSFRWSPDGTRLAYIATTPKQKREKSLDDAGYGFTYYEENLKSRNLYLTDVGSDGPSGEANQITDGINVWSVEFAPDGKTASIGASELNLVDQEYMFQHIYLVDLETKTRTVLVERPNKIGNYAFSPDGAYLAYNGALERKDHRASQVYVVPISGGTPRNLTIPKFRGHVTWVKWLNDGSVLYRSGEGVHSTLSAVKREGGERKVLLDSRTTGVVFERVSMTKKGAPRMVCVGESGTVPGEVYYAVGDKLERVTNVNPWLADRSLGRQEAVRFKARDGVEIEGLLIHPVGYMTGQRYPLVVVVHGGPESHYSDGWLTGYSAPAQALAGKGYLVFYPNYRASTGYGVDFALQGYGDPAGKEFDDIADGIDYLVEKGLADRDRVGLGGGSYGGYASAWFATYYTKYVKAVCMFVGISDQVSNASSSDISWEHVYVHWGKKVNEMWDLALKRSPIYYAHQSRTATLIMGGAADTRVHPTQSLELYRMMKMNDHPAVRLVQYPGEGHGNSKQPGRIDALYRTLDWYDWYVKDAKPLNGPMPPLDISDRYGLKLPDLEPAATVSSGR